MCGTRDHQKIGSDGPPAVSLTTAKSHEIWVNKNLISSDTTHDKNNLGQGNDGSLPFKDRYTYFPLRTHWHNQVRRFSSWHHRHLAGHGMGRSSTRKTRRCEGRCAVFYLRVGDHRRTSRTTFLSLPSCSCRVPGSGSFIRQTPSIKYGTTFTRALLSKYVEDIHGSQGQEFVVLGSSNGIIEVEAVNLDKIRRKLSLVENLREVSIDGENVACAGSLGEIGKTCPSPFSEEVCSVRLYDLRPPRYTRA